MFKPVSKNMSHSLLQFKLAYLNQVNKGGIDSKRLPELCFTNVYVMALLNNYGFSNLENVKFVDEVREAQSRPHSLTRCQSTSSLVVLR